MELGTGRHCYPFFLGESLPCSFDGGDGIDEGTVHVEEQLVDIEGGNGWSGPPCAPDTGH